MGRSLTLCKKITENSVRRKIAQGEAFSWLERREKETVVNISLQGNLDTPFGFREIHRVFGKRLINTY